MAAPGSILAAPARSSGAAGRLPATTANVETRVVLADGRTLAFTTFGDAAGAPVIALHGTPGSRLKYEGSHEAALAAGLRLISIDRWGYGLSSPNPGGTLPDFARDVAALADRIGLGRFAVAGVSGGAPFAAAVAAGLDARVSALALVSPVGPIIGPVGRTWLSPFHAFCFRTLPRVPGAVPAVFGLLRMGLAAAPDRTMALAQSRSPAVDRLTIRDDATRNRLIETFKTGLEGGVSGPVADLALFAAPWGIDFGAIAAPTRIWIGLEDRNVPLAAVAALHGAIPACEMIRLTGQGHLWVSRNSHVVMDWLAAKARR
jgi:pimeloyl-ACP methyl ester carboxylesterase